MKRLNKKTGIAIFTAVMAILAVIIIIPLPIRRMSC